LSAIIKPNPSPNIAAVATAEQRTVHSA
jgi:hypothetical protein